METKAFEEKVYDADEIYGLHRTASEITSLIEPLMELVKAYEELVKEKDFIDKHRNHYYAIHSKLRQRINELRKQIE